MIRNVRIEVSTPMDRSPLPAPLIIIQLPTSCPSLLCLRLIAPSTLCPSCDQLCGTTSGKNGRGVASVLVARWCVDYNATLSLSVSYSRGTHRLQEGEWPCSRLLTLKKNCQRLAPIPRYCQFHAEPILYMT